MFLIESDLIDNFGTRKGYSWESQPICYPIANGHMQLYPHFLKDISQFPIGPVQVMPEITQQPLNIFGKGKTPRMASGSAQPSGNRGTHPMGFSPDQEERVNQKNHVSQDSEGINLARRTRSSRKKKHGSESDNQYGMRRRTRKSKRRNYSAVAPKPIGQTDHRTQMRDGPTPTTAPNPP